VGLKPSRDDVPAIGVIPLSTSLDHVGPLTRSVQDAAWMWSILSGQPLHTVAPVAPTSLRVAILGGYFDHPVDPVVRAAFVEATQKLTAAGVTVTTCEFVDAAAITDTYINIVLPEGAQWHGAWLDDRAPLYSPTVRDRLLAGRAIPATSYIAARHRSRQMRLAVDALLRDVDALILPTLPLVAQVSGTPDVTIEEVTMPVRAAMLKHTQLFNLTGHPAISLPLAVSGLPVGLQVVGPWGATTRLLDIAAACEALVCR
jgi:aspartyl-tRNA(Asn)/glutamyl-tRNA(Gln) amidotransferase subunit A